MDFFKFSWKNTDYSIYSENYKFIANEIKKHRAVIEEYIIKLPEFKKTLKPIDLLPGAPEIIKRMHKASVLTGVGPMASVAGVIAEFAVQSVINQGSKNVIIDNGGDIYLNCDKEIITGLYAGSNKIAAKLAFRIIPDYMPIAICSSSSKMGHSTSFGACDLTTVLSKDAALADAAATMACNMVKSQNDIENTLDKTIKIDGITGIIIVKDDKIGMAGNLPELIRNYDKESIRKISKHDSVTFIPDFDISSGI